MKKINVLQVGMATKNIGGVEFFLIRQFQNLDRDKMNFDFVNILSPEKLAFADEIEKAGSKIYNIPKRSRNPILHYYKFLQLIRENGKKYDAIILNSGHLYYIYPLILAKIYGMKHVVFMSHNSGDDCNMSIARKILVAVNRFLLNVFVTERLACSKKAGLWMYKNKRFNIWPVTIDVKSFIYDLEKRKQLRRKLNLQDSTFLVGNIGRYSLQKNQEFLVEIFNEIHKRNNDSKLIILGRLEENIYLKNVRDKIIEFGLENDVILEGFAKNIGAYYQAMDCFVLPSLFEGFPTVGIEAQCMGLPTFFSDSITEEIKLTSNAHFISLSESPTVWCDTIIKKSNPNERKRMDSDIVASRHDVSFATDFIYEFLQ